MLNFVHQDRVLLACKDMEKGRSLAIANGNNAKNERKNKADFYAIFPYLTNC